LDDLQRGQNRNVADDGVPPRESVTPILALPAARVDRRSRRAGSIRSRIFAM
jgi:hypothetical protein